MMITSVLKTGKNLLGERYRKFDFGHVRSEVPMTE